jgi:glycosyltransferase involved in cell wall biosynthesis
MKHLHFTQALEPLNGGGMGLSTVALHRQLLSMGVDSTLCSTYSETPQAPAERVFEFRRIKPYFIYFAPELQAKARQLVSATDVVHGHGLYVGTNFAFGVQARRQGKPLVYHTHGFFEPWILNRSRWKKRLVHWAFENANFRRVKLWRALTPKEADQIRGCGIIAPIVVAPNGLNPDEYCKPADSAGILRTPLVPELRKTGRRLLFLSRIHPKKGLDLLIRAWARLRQLNKDWEMVIAGPDEQDYMSVVRNLAQKLGLSDRVIFTGPVTGQTKTELFYSADLFALPSYSEGIPVSLLEAMACELPVVATQECNCPDISPTGAGWLCSPSVGSLVESLEAALSSAEVELRQRGQRGKRLVETSYSWPKIASEILRACEAHCS